LIALVATFSVCSISAHAADEKEKSTEKPVAKSDEKATDKSVEKPAEKSTDKLSEPIKMADGKLLLIAPKEFKSVKPKNNIIEHEFAIPAAEGDKTDGRLTIMGAGGDIDQNINRWISQFDQPDGSSTKDKSKVEKKKVGDLEVHVVDISGIYKDMPAGPFAKGAATKLEGYRMLSAIVVGPKGVGNYFIKFYGPEKTVTKNEAAFTKMLESLKKGE
jgi:hypothetical protein